MGARIPVRVQARASRDEIAGERGGALLVRLSAPPVEGRANEALCRLMAKRLGIARGRVSVVLGHRSRDKVVLVDGLPETEAKRLLEGPWEAE